MGQCQDCMHWYFNQQFHDDMGECKGFSWDDGDGARLNMMGTLHTSPDFGCMAFTECRHPLRPSPEMSEWVAQRIKELDDAEAEVPSGV